MFDILKKKISNFVDNITSKIKVEKKEPEQQLKEEKTPTLLIKPKEPAEAKSETRTEARAEMKFEVKKEVKKEEKKFEEPKWREEPKFKEEPKRKEELKWKEELQEKKSSELKEPKALEAKPSIFTKIKSFISPEVTIKEEDIRSVIDDFEFQLLTADVAVPVVEELVSELRKNLVGKKIEYKDLNSFVNQLIINALSNVMAQEKFDLIEFVRDRQKPVRILFIGPNGAGKTTTIAKLANLLKKNGFSPILAASDTFRAAAIEQTAEHASRIDVPVIKHQYGSDPAAVAFDAIKYAETHAADVVLIDTAGRQETNRNLIEQLKKISRVVKPDLKIFVGEGIAGNAIVNQVKEFNEAIGLDGVILTKIDVDTKGGTVISIKKATGVPILYIGVGQGYNDFIPFDPNFVTSKIMS